MQLHDLRRDLQVIVTATRSLIDPHGPVDAGLARIALAMAELDSQEHLRVAERASTSQAVAHVAERLAALDVVAGIVSDELDLELAARLQEAAQTTIRLIDSQLTVAQVP